MNTVLALVVIVAAVFRVADCETCLEASGTSYAAGSSGSNCSPQTHCEVKLTIKADDGVKSYTKACSACTTATAASLTSGFWTKIACCDNSSSNDDCNTVDSSAWVDLGPKCWKCDSKDAECVKGGDTEAAGKYDKETAICDANQGYQCYVKRMEDGTVKRGCTAAACVDEGENSAKTFNKCCLTTDYCNSVEATYKEEDKKDDDDKDGDKDGSQTVCASYALLLSCMFLAYLK